MVDFKIGIWGTARAGKTTYLAMLYHAFQAHPDWNIYCSDASRSFVEKAFEVVIEQHKFPEKSSRTASYQYTIEKRNGDGAGQRVVLEFLDAPGELYEMYYDRQRRNSKVAVAQRDTEAHESDVTPQEIFDYLKSCDGIIIFLDPAWATHRQAAHSYELMLLQLLEDLRASRVDERKAPFLALCITKVDGSDALWGNRKIPTCDREISESQCREKCPVYGHIGPHFMTHWLTKLNPADRVKCFAVSSIGRVGDEMNISADEHWQRDVIPMPPQFSTIDSGGLETLKKELMKVPVGQTFAPRSVNSSDKLSPYELLSPIEWIIGNFNL